MNKYQKAYSILGLDPGSSKEKIQTRWKRLAMVWHPDRFPSDEGKKDAEEELKKINNAKDVLWAHLDGPEHKQNGCECQEPIGSQSQTGGQPGPDPRPGPGPGPGRKTNAEAEAERRDAARKAKAAAEEAARKAAQQQQERAQQGTFEAAQKEQVTIDEEEIRWKVSKILAIVFLALSAFGWIGSGIGDAIRHTASTISDTIRTNTEEKKYDPCALSGQPQTTQPPFVRDVPSDIKDKILVWKVDCHGTSGATVEGRGERNVMVLFQTYAPDWSLDHQDVVQAQGSEVSVDRYKKPGGFQGRCIYRYDSAGHLLSIDKLDSEQRTDTTATIERRPTGGFLSTTIRPVGGNTRTLYTHDDPQINDMFYMAEMFARIDKNIDAPSTLVSPDQTQPLSGLSDTTNPFKIPSGSKELSPFSPETDPRVRPNPFATPTNNGGHLSPSPFGTQPSMPGSPYASPTTDDWLKKVKDQIKEQNEQKKQ